MPDFRSDTTTAQYRGRRKRAATPNLARPATTAGILRLIGHLAAPQSLDQVARPPDQEQNPGVDDDEDG